MSALPPDNDTIAAVATPPGYGGIGIVRVSGPRVQSIARIVTGTLPAPRHAHLSAFRDASGQVLDEGIVLFFPGPASFTGEDVLELQGHGGPMVMELLLGSVLAAGARAARPGEFSERAFLNGRIDLTRAEAIADLIASGSARAARSAARSMTGVFADQVNALVDGLIALRVQLEAGMDFPEEAISPAARAAQLQALTDLEQHTARLIASAHAGVRLAAGQSVVLAGLPNVGKSSLLNALARSPRAIVSATPGTTRDVLREQLLVNGLPVALLDTAGLRDSGDDIEREGMARARAEAGRADTLVLVIEHDREPGPLEQAICAARAEGARLILVRNKIDLAGLAPASRRRDDVEEILLSAATGAGIDLLESALASAPAPDAGDAGEFSARQRHVDALQEAAGCLRAALVHLRQRADEGELAAEQLRLAQLHLAGITGDFSADDLLGEIFAGFCIGK